MTRFYDRIYFVAEISSLMEALLHWGAPYAGVSEWQTRQTQNLLWATTCGFKSRCRQYKNSRKSKGLGKTNGLRLFLFCVRNSNSWHFNICNLQTQDNC